jgi:hypothetical protein
MAEPQPQHSHPLVQEGREPPRPPTTLRWPHRIQEGPPRRHPTRIGPKTAPASDRPPSPARPWATALKILAWPPVLLAPVAAALAVAQTECPRRSSTHPFLRAPSATAADSGPAGVSEAVADRACRNGNEWAGRLPNPLSRRLRRRSLGQGDLERFKARGWPFRSQTRSREGSVQRRAERRRR